MIPSLTLSAPQLCCTQPYSTPNKKDRAPVVNSPCETLQLKHGVTTGGCKQRLGVVEGSFRQIEARPLIALLKDCAENGWLEETKAVHGLVTKSQFVRDGDYVVLLNHLVQAYSKCSDFEAACEVFGRMVKKNIFSWTLMIVGSTENGCFLDGFGYFCQMLDRGVLPDAFVCSSVIQSCIGLDSIRLGEMVHAHVVVTGFTSHDFVSSSLLNMYAKLGKLEDAYQVFDFMGERNQVSWNSVISALTTNGLHKEAYSHYLMMTKEGVTANVYTLVSVLKSVGMLGDISVGREIHKSASELGFESDIHVGTALIDMYCKCSSSSDARSVFERCFADCQVNIPWNAMISGYLQCGLNQEALDLYVRMHRNNVQPDVYTYCSVFNIIANIKCLQYLKEVHSMVVKSGCTMTITSVCNAVADAYSKCGSLEDVKRVFRTTDVRDVVTWTTTITALCLNSEEDEAISIFSQMRAEGFTPNEFTFAGILVACARLCSFEYGQQVHALLLKTRMYTEKCVESALVDMYAKCGSMCDAKKTFEMIPNPDVVSWTAIISGYAQHGHAREALESGCSEDGLYLRRVMKKQGVRREPGCSWITVNGEVHKFYAGDRLHPQKSNIYNVLEKMKVTT
uniref:Pentatricopeptide repeat-containing protein n=1 Tax=Kalanchoe fedtschenkoi TaxID=63787 RepID=A0A7N0UQE5_KALFE